MTAKAFHSSLLRCAADECTCERCGCPLFVGYRVLWAGPFREDAACSVDCAVTQVAKTRLGSTEEEGA